MGTMKHKGDLKLKLTINKVNEIVELQKKILDNIVKYISDNGTLVYSTCTINKDENERQIRWFTDKYKEFEIIEEISLLPSSYNDGFYICKLIKKSDN
jgi:16S rRNA (cytosine967-C5)-methyltransferase